MPFLLRINSDLRCCWFASSLWTLYLGGAVLQPKARHLRVSYSELHPIGGGRFAESSGQKSRTTGLRAGIGVKCGESNGECFFVRLEPLGTLEIAANRPISCLFNAVGGVSAALSDGDS